MKTIAALVVSSVLAAACGGSSAQTSTTRVQRTQLAPDQDAAYKQAIQEGDAAWQQRDQVNSLKTALVKWEKAVQIKQDDWQTYAKLARGYYFLADGTYQFDSMGGTYPYDPDKVADQAGNDAYLNAHLRGTEHAQRGMAALSPEFEKRLAQGTKIEELCVLLGRDGVPLVYWYASNMGKYAKARGTATVLQHKDRIFKMVTFVYETANDYYHSAPDRYFGAFYAVAPSFAGGDLKRSEQHFAAAIKASPQFIGTYVLAAELHATAVQDQAAFDRYLKTVVDAPEDQIPDLIPEFKVEKRKAAALIQHKTDLF